MKKRVEKTVNILIVIGASVVFIAYASYFIKLLIWPENIISILICIAVMLITVLPLIFHKKIERFLPSWLFNGLRYLFCAAFMFYTVTFSLLCIYIASVNQGQTHPDDLTEKTVFIVYGAGLQGERPGPTLAKRLNKALEMLHDLPGAYCIVTGSQGPNEVTAEAYAMRDYLIEHGISNDRILVDDKADNTAQNIKNSIELITEEGLDGYRIVSVSNAFHIPRIRLLCSRFGIDGDVALAEDPNSRYIFATLVREYMSYVKLLVFGAE